MGSPDIFKTEKRNINTWMDDIPFLPSTVLSAMVWRNGAYLPISMFQSIFPWASARHGGERRGICRATRGIRMDFVPHFIYKTLALMFDWKTDGFQGVRHIQHTHTQTQAHKNTIPMKYWTFAEWSWWQVAAIGDLVQSPYLKPLYDSRFFSYFCFVVVVVGGRLFSICCL